jgi:hypothetical protein
VKDFSARFIGLSNGEINQTIASEQRVLLRKWFGRGPAGRGRSEEAPSGLTRETLEAYHEIARRTIAEGKDPMGTQQMRLKRIDEELEARG